MKRLLLLATGCNQVWSLDSTHLPIDAMTSVDEDLDDVLNEVDNCPGIYNPGQPDRDGDLVGDVCDPHPDTMGDSIVAKAFFSTSQIDLWTPDTAETWTVIGGALVPKIDANATNGFLTLSATAQRPSLEVGYTVLDYGADGTTGNLFALTLALPNDIGTWRVQSVGANGPFRFFIPAHNGALEDAQNIDSQGVNTTHTIRCTRDAQSSYCVLDGLVQSGAFGIGSGSAITARMELQSTKLAIRYTVLYAGP